MTPARQPAHRPRGPRRSRRRQIAARRGAVIAVAAVVGLVAGLVIGARHDDQGERLARRYAAAFANGDWAALYRELTTDARRRVPLVRFARAHREALATATATAVTTGRPRRRDGMWRVPVRVTTRAFGPLEATLALPTEHEDGAPRVPWRRDLVFPGLRPGEALHRTVRLAPRATLLARDGTVLARGADRSSPDPALAASVAGRVGPAPADRAEALQAAGVPADARVGLSGLERAFDDRLRGTPGGTLLAGGRVLAQRAPVAGGDVRTTIVPRVERAAVAALAGRVGGVVVLRPRTGAVLAFAGIPFSGLQPPGSTFKVVTVTAGLEAGVTRPAKAYPVQTSATIEGVKLQNANGESCGGTLVRAFAESCNSVFAPMGVAVGARRLVATAQRFGLNQPPDLPGVATSTIPSAQEIGDDLAVGSTAIGQGRVQATTLQMATIAATIGRRGRRPRLTLDAAAGRRTAPTTAVTSPRTARTVERLMRAVVTGGTGTGAAIAGVPVAGKTGTAELRSTQRCTPQAGQPDPEACQNTKDDPTDTDAWFVAYAPAGKGRPKVAVGVLLVGAGAGGQSAAPVARSMLLAALGQAG